MQSEPSSRVEPNGLCRCGHTGKTHPYQGRECPCVNHGCDCRAFVAQFVPTVLNDCCKCGHNRFRHCYDTVDGPCSKPDCACKAYAPVTVETVELPEPEYTPCVCGHIEPHHRFEARSCYKCACAEYRPVCRHGEELVSECPCTPLCGCCPAQAVPLPPQPERRPPLTVQYSVAGGHPYEVSIPGDASVTAEDGVLIIKHPSAQILAITRVAPMEG